MNFRVFILALVTFAVGTASFIVTGILGDVAESLGVSVGTAGHLVSVFAVVFAALSPVLVAATTRVERRRLLVVTLILFTLSNVAAALAPTFSVLVAFRVAAACCAAVLAPVAMAVAAQLAPPEQKGRALSVTIGGVSMAWVVGVPLGAVIADYSGWRASFILVAIVAAIAAAGLGRLLPAVKFAPPTAGFLSRLAVAGRPVVLVTLLVTTLGLAASFIVLTYLRPLLESLTGFGGVGIGLMFLVFGLASIAGSVLGGYGADRWGYRANAIPVLVVLMLSLFSFSLLPGAEVGSASVILGTAAVLVVWSVVGFALVPLQQYRLIGVAPDEQNGVLSLNSSAVYAGQGLGAVLGSLVLGYSSLATLGFTGALCAALALIVLVLSTRRSRAKDADQRKVLPAFGREPRLTPGGHHEVRSHVQDGHPRSQARLEHTADSQQTPSSENSRSEQLERVRHPDQ